LSGQMKSGRGRRIPRVPGEFARPEEGRKGDADCCTDIDTVEVGWNEGKELEEDVFCEWEPETTFSFPIKPLGALDGEVDSRIVKDASGHPVARVVRSQRRCVAFKRRGADRGSKKGEPIGDGHDCGGEGRVISAAAERFVRFPDRGVGFVSGGRE
jgi:hypothetical protein